MELSTLIHSVSFLSYDSSETLSLQLFSRELCSHIFMLIQTFLEAISLAPQLCQK